MQILDLPVLARDSRVSELREAVQHARFVTALTGAGISVASGLPLLRGDIHGVPLREFFRRDWFEQDPSAYFRLYRTVWQRFRLARPNQAHTALAQRGAAVITQNIDGLHRDAGTRRLIELHGNLRELHCVACRGLFGSELVFREAVPRCPQCGSVLRPGFTLEGDPIRHFARALDWVGNAEVVLIIGTSLSMDPVRRLPIVASRRGCWLIRINRHAQHWVPWLLGSVSESDKP